MHGLYAIVDVTTLARRGLPVVEVARAIARARPAALQLRAKELSPREALTLLRAIHPICREEGLPLFANDRADLAVLAGCEGVHVGQEDLPVSVIRRIAPGLRIGLSTHNLDELERAISDRPDYVAFGPIFSTQSKARHEPEVGLLELSRAVKACPVPVVAIGGIDLARAREVAPRAPASAIIAGLLPDDIEAKGLEVITERARALHAALRHSAARVA
jgi:thiamine-phosphate pyrophosphorylase